MLRKHASALVVEAEDGSQALDVIQHSAVDAVFLDLQMPVMDGLEVLATLRGDIAYQSLPVIVLSSLSDLATVRLAIKLGITDYLVKPLRPRLMEARLQSLLAIAAKRQATTGGRAPAAPGPAAESRRRVLLVDGDTKFAAFFTALLKADHEVVQVDNGREAARVLTGWTPDIACLGSRLRLPSELELARKLRKLHGGCCSISAPRRPPSPARRPRSSTRSCRGPSSPRPSARSSPGCAPPRARGNPRARACSMTGSARTSRRRGASDSSAPRASSPRAPTRSAPPWRKSQNRRARRMAMAADGSTAAAAAADPGIDYTLIAELRALADGDPTFLPDLFAAFVRDGARRADAIETAAARGEWTELARAAHALLGLAATIGARQISALCRALEEDLKREAASATGARPLVAERVRRIRAEVERATPLLETLLRP